MLLLHVTTADLSLELLLGPQLRAFRDAGYEVLGASAPGPYVARLEADGIAHVALRHATRGAALASDARLALELYRLFRRLRPDIVHTHNPKPGVLGRVAARLARVPVVVNTQHGLYATPGDPLPRRAAVYALERVAAACSDVELVQNPEDVETLARLGVPRRRLVLLGNGIDLARFDPERVPRPPRAPGEVVVVVVSRLVWEKGYREVFDAARLLRERPAPPPVRFVVAGPVETEKADALSAEDVAAAEALGVTFLGMRHDVEAVYAGADVNVLVSYREGWPRSPMEAAALGVPTVASDIRGCREVVEHERTGLLVPPRDARALADAVERLANDAALRDRLGAAARAKAVRDFDQRRVIDTTLATYRRLSRRRTYRLKRVLDVLGAAGALVAAAPVMAVIAAAIRVRLGSPVLFRQSRPGLGGQTFELVKFRTMADRRGADGELLPDDQRMTRLGSLLRRWSLDELPELVNVLRGEMSLVGPRPLLVEYLPLYSAEQARRHDVRPGITGWTQVNGRNDIDWSDKLALDVWYVDNVSLRLDVRILWRTVRQVLTGSGVAKSGHATTDWFSG